MFFRFGTLNTRTIHTMASSNLEKKCGCKGIRTCLLCESDVADKSLNRKPAEGKFTYCSSCEKAWLNDNLLHPHREGKNIDFPGIYLIEDFINRDEEKGIAEEIDKTRWVLSQSGRQKQDYGPKVNFKRKKMKKGNFSGLPPFSRKIVERFTDIPMLKNFKPVELCNLEYVPDRGSTIDPHFDDFWLWGERLVTLNLLSSTFLTMTCDSYQGIEVAVPMPARSLIIVHGPARNVWKHGIHREDVTERRLAVTLRELTPEFLEGGEHAEVGAEMLDIALTFDGKAVGV